MSPAEQVAYNPVEQVAYESRVRMRYAVIAFLAALLIVGSQLIQLSGTHVDVDELTLDLITVNKRFPLDLIGAIVNSFGLFALLLMLAWVHDIARARTREIRAFVRWLVVVGAGVSAVIAVIYAIVVATKAHDFVSSGNQSYLQAHALTNGGLVVILPLLAQLASLLLTVGFIWTALNGMRVGLIPRPLAYAGVLAGALVLFPLGVFVPFVQGFWLVAMSVLIAGRWPSGSPEAWSQGVAVALPTAGQPRQTAGPSRPARGAPRGRRARLSDVEAATQPTPPAAATVAADDADDATPARTRSGTPKRKRKRRS
jgi:hypothetical protein